MTDQKTLEHRIVDLERHVAHLEAANQDLSGIVARQWDEIDKLVRTIRALHERIQALEEAAEARRPPHY